MSDYVEKLRLAGGLCATRPAQPVISEKLAAAREYEAAHSAGVGDPTRPAFHISTPCGWLNDPNGLSFFNGKYHQFFQYHPYSPQWGPMHWGHAVSDDLVTWQYLPCALAPDQPFDEAGCYSGTAYVLDDETHLLMYTGVRAEPQADGSVVKYQTQCLALGDGLNYEKFTVNPVIDGTMLPDGFSQSAFRDPKIWRYGDTFYAAMANKDADGHGAIVLFTSQNLTDWQWLNTVDCSKNELGAMWECPDLFTLGDTDMMLISVQGLATFTDQLHNGHEVMMLAGRFDPATGLFDRQQVLAVDQGIDFYAPQTIATPDGRRVIVGWMQAWESSKMVPPNHDWLGMMSIPRELEYVGGQLRQRPIAELANYRGKQVLHRDVPVCGRMQLDGVSGRVADLTVTVHPNQPGSYQSFQVDLCHDDRFYTRLSFDPAHAKLTLDRTRSGFPFNIAHSRTIEISPLESADLQLRIILDRFSVEVFVNDGRHVMSATVYTGLEADQISFSVEGEAVIDVEYYELIKP